MPPAYSLAAPARAASPLRDTIRAAYRGDEAATVRSLLAQADIPAPALAATQQLAARLAQGVRAARTTAGGVDALMLEFSLDSREGVALMCLAEALLRVPDPATRDRLIRDKIGPGDWRAHVGRSASRRGARGRARLAPAQGWRAADPQGRRPGHAPARQAVRDRAHDRGGDRQRARARGAWLPLFVRHARRGCAHVRGRAALRRRLRAGDRRHRCRVWGRGRLCRSRGVDQALGAAPALYAAAARARARRASAARRRAGAARPPAGHRF